MKKLSNTLKDPPILIQLGTKMRIKLFSPEGILQSDRLVEQTTEFTMGPKEVHSGPILVEVNLFDQVQVDSCIEYLKKLKGDLPLSTSTKKIKIDKTLDKMLSDKEPLLDLIKTAKAKGTSQEKLIDFLREYQFKFISGDIILDMVTNDPNVGNQIKLRPRDLETGFQYMVRLVKEAKEPLNDKYDFRLVFGIKILGDKIDKVVIYLWGEFSEHMKLPWDKKNANNFKKVEKLYIFPEFMDYAERKRWRSEHRKWLIATKGIANPESIETSKFYNKYKPYVKGY
jgi:hypothetical protein